jgi:cytochrome b561
MNNYRANYSTVTQLLHWITAVLVLVTFIYGPGGPEQRVYSATRDADRQLHETLGLCVLALSMLRLAWLRFDRRPSRPEMPQWMQALSKAVHGALYLLLFVVPVTAITGAWLEGHPLTLLGGLEIPPLFGKSHSLGSTIASIHTWLGDTILWLAGFHALAGLYHHYLLKDNVLASMLPAGLPYGKQAGKSGD